ncbi:MAG: hypothetical protein QW356_01835 [Candidatus Hadarchaeales archaeon]
MAGSSRNISSAGATQGPLRAHGGRGDKGGDVRSVYEAVMFDVTKLARSEKIALSVMLEVVRRYGSKFSLNALAKEMEIGSHVTVRDYLEILEGLYNKELPPA